MSMRLVNLLLVSLGLVACGDSGSNVASDAGSSADAGHAFDAASAQSDAAPSDDANTALPTREGFCQSVTDALGAAYAACCPGESPADPTDYVTFWREQCDFALAGAAWTGGHATFDANAAAGVLARLEAAAESCPTDVNLNDAYAFIGSPIVGSLAAGDDCAPSESGDDLSLNYACAPDASCVVDLTGEGITYTCRTLAGLGQPCSVEEVALDCVAGAYCDDGTGVCVAKKIDDAACEVGIECVSGNCVPDGDPKDGTYGTCQDATVADAYCPAVG